MTNIEVAKNTVLLILEVNDKEKASALFSQNLEFQWNLNLALGIVRDESRKESYLKEGMEMFETLYVDRH